jgi:amidase
VLRYAKGYSDPTLEVFEANLRVLRDAGAILVDIDTAPDLRTIGAESFKVLMYELKADLNAYLASTDPQQVPTRTLADLIAFNSNPVEETALFGRSCSVRPRPRATWAPGNISTPARHPSASPDPRASTG